MPGVRTVTATRYVTPLREGGSLPALCEADDDGLYVVKFRGAGQGPKALAAEIVAGEVARALGLPVPELVLAELDPQLAEAEPDPEIQELLAASAGVNVGVDFLPGALPYAPAHAPDPAGAADVVWFDALVLNVDRTPRNPDLLPVAGSVEEADERLAGMLDRAALEAIAALVPEGWTGGAPYAEHLAARLGEPREWVAAAEEARRAAAAARFERDEEVDRGRA